MAYRGIPYFVAQSAGAGTGTDPYASNRHRMPDRRRGVRHSAAPRTARRIKPYADSGRVRPAAGTVPRAAGDAPCLHDVEPTRLLAAVALTAAAALAAALFGTLVLQGLSDLLDGAPTAPAAAAEAIDSPKATAFGTPRTNWQKGSVPVLMQDDPQWARLPYGRGTVASEGSAALCLAMVRIHLTGDASIGPAEAAALMRDSGAGGAEDAALLADGAGSLGLVAHAVDADELAIRRELIAGRPVVAAVSSPAFGPDAGCIVLCAVDGHSLLEIRDPSSGERTARHWSFAEVLDAATSLHSYRAAP